VPSAKFEEGEGAVVHARTSLMFWLTGYGVVAVADLHPRRLVLFGCWPMGLRTRPD